MLRDRGCVVYDDMSKPLEDEYHVTIILLSFAVTMATESQALQTEDES